jgi:heme exporter protein D
MTGLPQLHWNSLAEFLAMGGYGLYVWGSFLVTAAVLAAEGLLLVQRRKRALAELRNWRLLHDMHGDSNDTPT